MMNAAHANAEGHSMAQTQGATPPTWIGRPRLGLLADAIGGVRQNLDKLRQLASLGTAFFRPALVRERLERLRDLGHVDVETLPTVPQLLVAGRDQMMVSAVEETRIFYRSQGIPWVFHNLRRFISGPATLLDPVGLFAPRDAIVHHVLQTFHRHALYDLVLLRAHPGGVEAMALQAQQIIDGTHLHQRALTSLMEDGSCHARVVRDVAAFEADPHETPRPIPAGLVSDPDLMIGMDQFKDIAGFARYAARLDVGVAGAIGAWLRVWFDETIGGVVGVKLGPSRVQRAACDPEVVARYA
jgi:hypothetical protein